MSKSMKQTLQKQMTSVNNNFKKAVKQLENCKNENCISENSVFKDYENFDKLMFTKCANTNFDKLVKCRKQMYIKSDLKKKFAQYDDCKIKNCSKESKQLLKTLNDMNKQKHSLDKQYKKSMKTNNSKKNNIKKNNKNNSKKNNKNNSKKNNKTMKNNKNNSKKNNKTMKNKM
jgi:hypothetical protein